MRELSKMAELKFEAPLAQFESEEWVDFSDYTTSTSSTMSDSSNLMVDSCSSAELCSDDARNSNHQSSSASSSSTSSSPAHQLTEVDNTEAIKQQEAAAAAAAAAAVTGNAAAAVLLTAETAGAVADNFTETYSGSLEDLVNTFDDKITKCFCNFDESVEKLAPVQVRSQEEIMNECQMWWTITGNFGNILPIDWSKSYARKLHMPALNLNESKEKASPEDDLLGLSDEDEAVASDLDMHALILSGLQAGGCDDDEPVKTAEEVLREIDDIMQETTPSTECSVDSEIDPTDAVLEKGKEVLQSPLYEDKLRTLSLSELNELYLELEVLIREFSETLIAELAMRDELEYEKELKNTFISLLLAVQNRRRQHHVERKRNGRNSSSATSASTAASTTSVRSVNGIDPKYLTTVIPYHLGSGPPNNQALQVLIKILKAINEDSPTVPTLLTDYILKVLCPT